MSATAPPGAVRRWIRLFVPPRSALRRGSDRVEAAARWVLLLVGLLLLPVALTAGGGAATHAAAAGAERHAVTGQVLAAPDTTSAARPDVAPAGLRAPVGWIAADGTS